MTPDGRPPRLRIRLHFGPDALVGPGRTELLERIARTGSIAAAAREMGMSYKRAWTLIESLNAMFQEPVVTSARGGPGVGGAALTPTGQRVIDLYRGLESAAAQAAAPQIQALCDLMADISVRK